MNVVDIIMKERKLLELSIETNNLIISIVRAVEDYNSKRGIPEVRLTHEYFENSHEAINAIGFNNDFGIIKFRIKLNKVSKFKWFWNPNLELVHKYCWEWGDKSYANKDATVEMYEYLVVKLKIVLGNVIRDIGEL